MKMLLLDDDSDLDNKENVKRLTTIGHGVHTSLTLNTANGK